MRIGLVYSSKILVISLDTTLLVDLPFGDVAYINSSIVESETRLNYMQLTMLSISEKTAFYALLGPYLSIGLKGNVSERQTYEYTDNVNPANNVNIDISNEDEIQFGQDESGFDYVNYGFTPVIGFRLNSFFIEMSYDIGLNDIQTNNEDDFKVYDRTFSNAWLSFEK